MRGFLRVIAFLAAGLASAAAPRISGAGGAAAGERIMELAYGPGRDAIDTTRVDLTDPWMTLVQSFRVEENGVLSILTAGPECQSVRRFRSRDGVARETERIDLPPGVGRVEDFLGVESDLIVSRPSEDEGTHAVFYRCRGDSILEAATLPRAARFNTLRGRTIANLGRLRLVGVEIWNCFPPNSSSLRIGTVRQLKSRLGRDDVIPGVPTLAGEILWADAIQVARGIHPILDLTSSRASRLEEVFDDGGFVVRRTAESRLEERYDLHAPDGELRSTIVIPAASASGYHVGDGESLYFTPDYVYEVRFEREGAALIRYSVR